MKFYLVALCVLFCASPYIVGQAQAQVLPYPGDCTKYQHCDASGCFIMSCGAGTEFNPAINACDYPLRDRQGCQRG